MPKSKLAWRIGGVLLLSLPLARGESSLWPFALPAVPSMESSSHLTGVPVGDFDGDGFTDFLFLRDSRSRMPFTLVYGGNIDSPCMDIEAGELRSTEFTWGGGGFDVSYSLVYGHGDINGDGMEDLILGYFFDYVDPGAMKTFVVVVFGSDLSAESVVDLARVEANGTGFVLCLDTSSEVLPDIWTCSATHVPAVGDFNGDGIDDFALWRPTCFEKGSAVKLFLCLGQARWPSRVSIDELVSAGKAVLVDCVDAAGSEGLGSAKYHRVVPVGDLDGDGRAELAWAVADSMYEEGGGMSAASWIIWGCADLSALVGTAWIDLVAQGRASSFRNLVLTGSAGDMDGDGFGDALAFTVPEKDPNQATFDSGQSEGIVIYGGTRQSMSPAGGLEWLNPGVNCTRLPPLPATPRYFPAGVRHMAGGTDLDGDGIPDIALANSSLEIAYGEFRAGRAGQVLLVAGVRGRPVTIAADAGSGMLWAGTDHWERLGAPLSFSSRRSNGAEPFLYAVAGARLDIHGYADSLSSSMPLRVACVPQGAGVPASLAVSHWRGVSSYRIMIVGAGFCEGVEVFFGGVAGHDMVIVSPCCLLVTAPPGTAGEEVDITVRQSGKDIVLPSLYVYPVTSPTRSLSLDRLVSAGKAHRFAFEDASADAYTCIPVGDVNADGVEEIAIGVARADTDAIWLLPCDARLAPSTAVFASEAPVVARVSGATPGMRLGTPVAAADLDGDGVSDIVCTGWTSAEGGFACVVFGGSHLQGDVAIDSGMGVLQLGPTAGVSYPVVQLAGDIDGDGTADLVLGLVTRGVNSVFVLYGGAQLRSLGRIGLDAVPAASAGARILPGTALVMFGDHLGDGNIGAGLMFADQFGVLAWGEKLTGELEASELCVERRVSSPFYIDHCGGLTGIAPGPVDFDGDGRPDLVACKPSFFTEMVGASLVGVVGFFSGEFLDFPSGRFDLGTYLGWLVQGMGQMTGTPRYYVGDAVTSVGDLNGDSRTDFVVLCADRLDAEKGARGVALLLLGDASWSGGVSCDVESVGGVGVFLDTASRLSARPLYQTASRDVNDDGLDDFVVAFSAGPYSKWNAVPLSEAYLVLGSVTPYWDLVREMFQRADVNDDGKVDIADAIFILGYLFAWGAVPGCVDAADANDDGKVDIADVIAILGHLFANSGPLPAPFGECGTDPTDDTLGCFEYSHCEP
ncbi:MAG TPA: dockerin type I domain-containing protein [Planctomycetota bacterium]|jgi:hypothetical protein|nr:dockerin type I domain-containing protein [Planctomycetota bacterium]HOE87812.1 dockerin type I domain-containing protein [Planctomycetota bacterium]HPL59580.1 dockerin type I domain-containing protein [Planctomycetota bacterium]HQF64729.1 dockerin type I domain-containing protein [Planctomycetota bacterium]